MRGSVTIVFATIAAFLSSAVVAQQSDDVKLRCEGRYRDTALDRVTTRGAALDFELEIRTSPADPSRREIWLISALSPLGWFYVDDGYSSSTKYVMNSRNEYLEGWADDYMTEGFIRADLNLDRETGEIFIRAVNDGESGVATFTGTCRPYSARF